MDNYFMDLHERLSTHLMTHSGLCNEIDGLHHSTFELFRPEDKDRHELIDNDYSTLYWASGKKIYESERKYTYTELRQTIILFCHEILNS